METTAQQVIESQKPAVQAGAPAADATPAAPTLPVEPAKPQDDEFVRRFAALTRQQKQLLEREKALKAREDEYKRYKDLEELKSKDPWAFAKQTNLDLDAVISGASRDGQPPSVEDQIKALNDKISSYEKLDQERQLKAEQERQQMAVDTFRKKINSVIEADLEKYEMLNLEDNKGDLVFDVINEHFEKTMSEYGQGDVLDIDKAAEMVENYLVNRALKYTQAKKLQSKLAPPVSAPETQVEQKAVKESHIPGATLNSGMTASTSLPTPRGLENADQAKRRIAAEFKARMSAQR